MMNVHQKLQQGKITSNCVTILFLEMRESTLIKEFYDTNSIYQVGGEANSNNIKE